MVRTESETIIDPPRGHVAAPAMWRDWWPALLALAVAFAAIGFAYFDAIANAVRTWTVSPTYNHAYLVIPIVLYLIWDRRDRLAGLSPRLNIWGLLAIPAFGFAWLIGEVASIMEGQHLAIVGMIQGVLLGVLGWPIYRTFLFAFLYLFFLAPSGAFLVPALQDFTAEFAVGMLRLVDIPVYIDGLFLAIPNGLFEVAEACAGLRFLIAMIAFGFVYAYLIYYTLWRRLLFIALCVVVPIIANGFRAFGIVMLAHLSDNTIAVGADHLVYGWLFFSLVMLLLIWIGLTFREKAEAEDVAVRAGPIAGSLTAARQPMAPLVSGLIAAVLIALPLAAAKALDRPAEGVDPAALGHLNAAGWRASGVASNWTPHYPSADRLLRQSYVNADGRTVDLAIAFYTHQRKGAEIIQFENRLADGETWARAAGGRAQLDVDGRKLAVQRARLRNDRGRFRVALRWFWVDDTMTAGGLRAKLAQLSGTFITGRRAAAAIMLSAPYEDQPDEAVALIRGFLGDLEPIGPVLRVAAGP